MRLTPYQVAACAERCGLEPEFVRRAGNDLECIASALDQLLVDTHFCGRGGIGRAVRGACRCVYNALAVA